ncbi:MAG: hypothetical protein ACLFWL_07955 [Candidatus Brocadiia bacterium]
MEGSKKVRVLEGLGYCAAIAVAATNLMPVPGIYTVLVLTVGIIILIRLLASQAVSIDEEATGGEADRKSEVAREEEVTK